MKRAKVLLIIFFSLSALVCSFKQSKTKEPISKEKSIEIEQAVKQYFATKQPPIKVLGINPYFFGEYYSVRTDVELPDGKRDIRTVRYRQYMTQGNSYWKVEE